MKVRSAGDKIKTVELKNYKYATIKDCKKVNADKYKENLGFMY